MTNAKFLSLILLCMITFSAMGCGDVTLKKNAAHQFLFTDAGAWISSNTQATESIAGPESSRIAIPDHQFISIPGQGDSFEALGMIRQENPDYVLTVKNIQWNGVIRQAWFQQHYQLQHTFFDNYDPIAPAAIYASKPSPFDVGRTITITHAIIAGDTGDAPAITAYQINTNWLLPGRNLYLTMTWDPASSVYADRVILTIMLYSEKNQTPVYTLTDLFHPDYETFFDTTMIKTYHTLVLPSDLSVGEYSLRMVLSQENGAPFPVLTDTGVQADFLTLLAMQRPAQVAKEAVFPPHTTDYRFLENNHPVITLTGFDILTETTPGVSLPVDLLWHVTQPPEGDYTVFVHIRDAQNNVVAQADNKPVDWIYPTVQWQTEQNIVDTHNVAMAEDLPRGTYFLFIGLYDAQTGQRLPIIDVAGQKLVNDEIRLSQICIR